MLFVQNSMISLKNSNDNSSHSFNKRFFKEPRHVHQLTNPNSFNHSSHQNQLQPSCFLIAEHQSKQHPLPEPAARRNGNKNHLTPFLDIVFVWANSSQIVDFSSSPQGAKTLASEDHPSTTRSTWPLKHLEHAEKTTTSVVEDRRRGSGGHRQPRGQRKRNLNI